MQIKKITHEMVYPAPLNGPPHPLLLEMSEVDQLLQGIAIPKLFFFKEGSLEAISCMLKESLSKLLAIFYPLAGRIVPREGGGGRVDVCCMDQGAIFYEAWADFPLSIFGLDVQPHPSFKLLIPDLFESNAMDALLHVQVTHFSCGGFCLCVQEYHILCDGASNAHFMESWVDILNGNNNLTLYPYMNLCLLRDKYTLARSPMSPFDLSQLVGERVPTPEIGVWSSKIFHFTPSFIEGLREDGKNLSHRPTSFECIIAYLWKNIVRAHQANPDEETSFGYVVNGRQRFDPPLPLGYFGNAIFMTFAHVKVEDLMKNPLSYAMNLIKEATSKISSDYMKYILDVLEKQHLVTSFASFPRTITATTWANFPLCDLNFPWGKPCFVRTNYMSPHLVNIIIFPSSFGKGYMDVQVNLNVEHIHKLEALIRRDFDDY